MEAGNLRIVKLAWVEALLGGGHLHCLDILRWRVVENLLLELLLGNHPA